MEPNVYLVRHPTVRVLCPPPGAALTTLKAPTISINYLKWNNPPGGPRESVLPSSSPPYRTHVVAAAGRSPNQGT